MGTRGTAVSFTAEEITAITEADSTSLAVVQTATGIRSTLSVPTNTDAQGLLVYPNPLHAQLHLVYPSATPATYTVFDLTGKVHSTHQASGQTHQLNVSSLAKGVYLLKAQHGNQSGVFRFVKE